MVVVIEQLVSLHVQPHILLILLLRDVVSHILLFRSLYSSGKALLDSCVYLCWFICFFDVCVCTTGLLCRCFSLLSILLSDVVHYVHLTETQYIV